MISGVRIIFIACIVFAMSSTLLAEKPPVGDGPKIQKLAGAAKLDPKRTSIFKQGKEFVQFTSAVADSATQKDMEKGIVVGKIEARGISQLPDGVHNVFVVKEGQVWTAYFESAGKIVATTKDVSFKPLENERDILPTIRRGSISITISIGRVKLTITVK